MRTVFRTILSAAVGTALVSGAAIAAHVPGDYPTIQAAIDAVETQIVVEAGTYPESLHVWHAVHLVADTVGVGQVGPFVHVAGMRVDLWPPSAWPYKPYGPPYPGGWVYVLGFHFLGPVTQKDGTSGAETMAIEACWLDGGFNSSGGGHGIGDSLGIRGCRIQGGVDAYSYTAVISENTVIGGGVRVYSSGGAGVIVRDNLISGAPQWGIEMWGCCTPHVASRNTIRDSENGITCWEYGYYDHNLVEDCRGTAYRGARSNICDNVARRCGGHGIDDAGFGRAIERNTVDSVGLCGIHGGDMLGSVQGNRVSRSRSHGIWVEGWARVISGNVVLSAGGDGIRASVAVESNVVGRSVGAGIVAASARHNTSFLNGGAGFRAPATDGGGASLARNIAYGNRGPGLLWEGSGTPELACNDWFDNAGGMVAGTDVGETDVSLDPMFCDLAEDDVHLGADSPLLSLTGCGLVGALGQGCVAVPMHFSLSPSVLNPRSNGRWVAGCLQPPVGYTAEEIDVRSIQLNGAVSVDSLGPVNVGDHDGDGVRDLEVKFDRSALALTVKVGDAVEVTVQGTVAGRHFAGATTIRVQGAPRSTASEREDLAHPKAVLTTSLQDVSPNPVRGAPVMHLTLANSRPATLALYDVSGRLVSSREVGSLGAGAHQVPLGGGLSPGIYLVRLSQGDAMWVRRVVVLD